MSNVSGVNGSGDIYGMGSFDGTAGMSPDALLEYCQMQMGSLDDQVDALETAMKQQTDDENTVKNLQSQLEEIGGQNGPQDGATMQKAVEAYDQAIDSIPDGDPTKAELQQALSDMTGKYGYDAGTPAQPLTPEEQQRLQNDQDIIDKKVDIMDPAALQEWQAAVGRAKADITQLQNKENGTQPTIGTQPDQQSWQGTTDAVGAIATKINEDAQMLMLELNQVASQQQNAFELTTQLLQKTDSTALDIAKNA